LRLHKVDIEANDSFANFHQIIINLLKGNYNDSLILTAVQTVLMLPLLDVYQEQLSIAIYLCHKLVLLQTSIYSKRVIRGFRTL
jgi:hypothetical protein